MYNSNNQIKFKTTMLKSSFTDYNDASILLEGTVPVVWQDAVAALVSAN